jgi:hypothetical protein
MKARSVGSEDGRRLKIGTRADEILARVCARSMSESIARGPDRAAWRMADPGPSGLGQRMWERIAVAASAP